ncbi:hypothetical protein Syun_012356 [Stephania yunnanensis]|uniref:Uncharacterized protein n=1 Tax=Stephania yunnanensis TaxID=152371 RepID=A0AAP0JZ95_9MAGN
MESLKSSSTPKLRRRFRSLKLRRNNFRLAENVATTSASPVVDDASAAAVGHSVAVVLPGLPRWSFRFSQGEPSATAVGVHSLHRGWSEPPSNLLSIGFTGKIGGNLSLSFTDLASNYRIILDSLLIRWQ